MIEVNSTISDIKKLSFNSFKNLKFKASFFVDNSKSPPRRTLELFFISSSILFFKIVTEDKMRRLIKIVKKTFEIFDLFLLSSFIKN